MKPLAIDLFCGKGGWSRALRDLGYHTIGFDIERWDYCGDQMVLQDVLTLDGRQFRNAALIVASPPCQEYSYMAMPWKRGKQIAAALRGQGEFPKGYTGSRTIRDLNGLFDACFRIQREAIASQDCDCGHPESAHDHDYYTGGDDCQLCSCCSIVRRHIPMVVENVRGAEPWVGGARWHCGSFYLWGNVPAVMPNVKVLKISGYSDPRRNGGKGAHLTSQRENDGRKGFAKRFEDTPMAHVSSKSDSRKESSARIAMIPPPLARWIGEVYWPEGVPRPDCVPSTKE